MNFGLPSGGLRLRTFLSSGRSEVAGEAALPASIVLSPPWATGSRRATAGCRTASQSPIIGREEPLRNARPNPPPPQPLPNRLGIIRRIRIHHLRPRPRPPPPALLHPQAPQHLPQPTAIVLIPRPHHRTQGKPIFIHQNVHFGPFPLLMPIDSYPFPPFFASTRVESTAAAFTFPSVYPQSRRACRIWCQTPFS
jgi:hypothetical protein